MTSITPFSFSRSRDLLWFDVPLLLLAGAVWWASSAAHDVASARLATSWFAGGVALALIVARAAHNPLALYRVGGIVALTALTASVAFITQYRYLGADTKISAIDALGMALSAPFPRMSSTMPMQNTVAVLLEGVIPLLVGLALDRRRAAWRVLTIAAAGATALAVLLTASRGAWMGLVAGAAVWVAITRVARPRRAAWAVVAFGAITLAGLAMTTRPGLAVVESASAMLGGFLVRPDRLEIYRESLTLLRDFAITGIGPGLQFGSLYSRHALLIGPEFIEYPHQLFIHVWLAAGGAGLVVWVVLLGAMGTAAGAGEQRQPSHTLRGTWIGLLVVLAHGLTDSRQAYDAWAWMPFFVLIGLLAAQVRREVVTTPRWAVVGPLATGVVVALALSWRVSPIEAASLANRGAVVEASAYAPQQSDAERRAHLEAAKDWYRKALASSPSQPTALRRLGLLAIEDLAFDDALAYLQQALIADPYSAATRKGTGLAAAWAGDAAMAATLLGPMPGMADELLVWSRAWQDRGRTDLAVHALRACLAIDPNLPVVVDRLRELEGGGPAPAR